MKFVSTLSITVDLISNKMRFIRLEFLHLEFDLQELSQKIVLTGRTARKGTGQQSLSMKLSDLIDSTYGFGATTVASDLAVTAAVLSGLTIEDRILWYEKERETKLFELYQNFEWIYRLSKRSRIKSDLRLSWR